MTQKSAPPTRYTLLRHQYREYNKKIDLIEYSHQHEVFAQT